MTFSSGISTCLDAAAARREQLLLQTADRQHSPRSVISPVIATSARTGMPVRIDTIAVQIAVPALGPSFGVAPSGRWMCRSVFCVEVRRDAELLGAMAHHRQRRRDRLVHHVAELAGGRRLALARQRHGLDRQQVAADLGPGEPGDLADLVLLLGDAVGVSGARRGTCRDSWR